MIIYTGKSTYNETTDPGQKKTVAIVKRLCKHLAGSHQTVYVDCFYTSLELMKELHDIDIYVTGTLMKNRIPRDLTIAKSTKVFKDMNRGDVRQHLYQYRSRGKTYKAGLVCWKDPDIVYCISNETDNVSQDKCT